MFVFLFLGCVTEKSAQLRSVSHDLSYNIAVLPFETSNPYLSGSTFSDYFSAQIIQNIHGVFVTERKDLMKLQEEQKLSLTGILQPDKISKIGSILGADALLVGWVTTTDTIQSERGTISVTIKLMEVSTGRLIWIDRQKISHSGWVGREVMEVAEILMEKTANKMVQKMKEKLPQQKLSASGFRAPSPH